MGAYIVISVLIFIICILLILIVLVQNSKGGGLASNFSSSNQFMGVRKTADFLEKATWTLAIALVVLSLVSIFVIPRANKDATIDTELREQINNEQPVDYTPAPTGNN
ncbi:MAG: preprotein translocase subunit SecG [Bacteroidales bacterium]|jgi:preprotein translocase subunit SecG|nr:preprotein translocase subunit SecG [Bacteroidales bacterium]